MVMVLYGYASRRKKQVKLVKHVTHRERLRQKNLMITTMSPKLPKFRKACPVIDVKCDADICW